MTTIHNNKSDLTNEDVDNFMPCFKYYKQKLTPPTFENVYDLHKYSTADLYHDDVVTREVSPPIEAAHLGLDMSCKWKIVQISAVPGLHIILNPFTDVGQIDWASRCLAEYPVGNKTNLDKDMGTSLLWKNTCHQINKSKAFSDHPIKKRDEVNLFKTSPIWKLRWTTLGYHHNWDTKVYSVNEKSKFPSELKDLSSLFAGMIGCDKYDAQAAIVNYYHVGSTLSAHTDTSEQDLTFPLISISLGLSAVFLVGGKTKTSKPVAIFIRSGDVLIMSKQSRLSYHAVPRIMSTNEDGGTKLLDTPETPVKAYLKHSRINMNVRQVMKI